MRTGASLRAKKMTGLRTGHFFTLRSARSNFGRAKPGQNSANSARIRLTFEFDANYFAPEGAKLCEAKARQGALGRAMTGFLLSGTASARVALYLQR